MKNFITFVGIAVLIASCAPKISTSITRQYPPLSPHEEVIVFGMQDPQPRDAEVLGIVRIGSPTTSISCDLYTILSLAMTEARKIGGNALNITEHIPNSNGCHQITATILKLDYPEEHSITTISENANYALLHLYRPNGQGHALSYELYLDTAIVARSSNNWRATIKIENEGQYTLRGRTQRTALVPLNIKLGNEYHVRSGVVQGVFIGRPVLTLVDNKFGRIEFQSVTTPVIFSTLGDTANRLERFAYPRFRFAINAGFGYRTAGFPEDINPDIKNFLQKMRSGFHLDLGATYFFSEWLGFGLNYNVFFASNEEDGWTWSPPGGGTPQHGKLGIQAQTTFVGPTFSWRLFDRQKRNCFMIDLGLGWLGHQEKTNIGTQHIKLDANAFGSYLNFGYDIWLSAATSLGFQFTIIGGSYSQFTETIGGIKRNITLPDGQFENIGRIALSVGLRF